LRTLFDKENWCYLYLNLLAGGYEMNRLNISAQRIFLDYCACKKNWYKNDAATTLNIEQLVSMVR